MFGNKMHKVEHAITKNNEAALIKLIDEKDKAVRVAAIAGLGKIGTDDGFNTLIPFLHNADTELKIAAVTALGDIGNGHARAFISNQLDKETDEQVRKAFSNALSKLKEY